MLSFYGGQQGQSFVISKIFKSLSYKTESDKENSLIADLELRQVSPIGVGEFVMISYGRPNDENYESYKNLDDKNYNSTLWQKIYIEEYKDTDPNIIINDLRDDTTYVFAEILNAGKQVFLFPDDRDGNKFLGLGYKLLGSLTGNTPIFDVDKIILDPIDKPDVNIDNTNIDRPELTFSLPRATKFYYHSNTEEAFKNLINTAISSHEVTIGNIEIDNDKYRKGDYLIIEETSYIYYINKVEGNKLSLEFEACLAILPKFDNIKYTRVGKDEESIIITRNEGSYDTYSAQFNLHSTIWHTDNDNTGEQQLTGDLYLDKEGQVYRIEGTGKTKVANIRGATGSITIKDSYDYAVPASGVEDIDTVSTAILAAGISLPESDEAIVVNHEYQDDSIKSYWYFYNKDTKKWSRALLTAGASAFIQDDDTSESNKTETTYSREYLDNKFEELKLTWERL